MSAKRFSGAEATGYLYVFFQSEDYPMNPSYITYDTDAMRWSDPVTLPMTLHPQDDGIYKSSPQAVYYNNQIYLFGRGADDHVQAMTLSLDGAATSDPVSLNDQASNAITPCVWNNNLYIFYPGAGNRLYCAQYDANLKWVNRWTSSSASTEPLTVVSSKYSTDYITVYYRDDSSGALNGVDFTAQGFPSGSKETGVALINGPSAMPLKSLPGSFIFYRNRADSTLWAYSVSDISTVQVDGVSNLDRGPSAILFDDGGGGNYDIAVFYVQPNGKLKVAGIRGIPGYPATFNLITIQDTGATLAGAGCNPFALAIS